MLQQWFIPKLNKLGIREEIYFLQDGAPTHNALRVQEYLNDTFPEKWIGHGSVTSLAPIEWPARSSDLTTCDNPLWEYIKDIVSKQCYCFNDELKVALTVALGTLPPAMLRKMSHRTWCGIILCSKNEGKHIDVLDA